MTSPQAIHRITTLWAITECGLGGFFHAVKTPFTGLVLGGMSVVYISLIAWHSRNKIADLSRALLFVLLVKFVVSPHSPLGAYFAVSLQALLGMLFFALMPHFKTAAVLTGIFSTVSSAVQKVLILVVLFGEPLWQALDQFVLGTAKKVEFISLPENFSASWWLAGIYVGIYFLGGTVIGVLAGKTPFMLLRRTDELQQACEGFSETRFSGHAAKGKTKGYLPFLFIVIALLAFVVEYFFISSETAFHQLIRTMLIIVFWMLLINPLLKYLLGKYLQGKRDAYENQIASIREMLPRMLSFARYAWAKSRQMEGRYRMANFILLLVYFGMYEA